MPFGREAQHSQVSIKTRKNKKQKPKTNRPSRRHSGLKQRNILAFRVSVQKKDTNSTRESATLFVQSFTHLLWNIQKKNVYKLKMVTTTARIKKKQKNFGVETGTRTITDIHIGPPPSVNTKQTHKYCFFRNLKYLKDLLPVFPDLKQKMYLRRSEEKEQLSSSA